MNQHDEHNESRRRGSIHLWPVAPDYRIEDGQVCPLVDGPFRLYSPAVRTELPGVFAKIATGKDAAVLDFVRRYGLLGYGEIAVREQTDSDAPLHRDPVSWIVAHAQTVQLALDLLGRLDDPAALRAFLATLRERPNWYGYRAAERGHLNPKHWQSAMLDRPPRDVALGLLEKVINPNLAGVSRILHVERQEDTGRQGLSSLFHRPALLDAIYWHLADVAIGERWVRRCKDPRCGAFFIAASRKVKYCPPPRGYYSEADEREPVSPCMNRDKQRTYRERAEGRTRRARAKGPKREERRKKR